MLGENASVSAPSQLPAEECSHIGKVDTLTPNSSSTPPSSSMPASTTAKDSPSSESNNIRVCVRVRPLSAKELLSPLPATTNSAQEQPSAHPLDSAEPPSRSLSKMNLRRHSMMPAVQRLQKPQVVEEQEEVPMRPLLLPRKSVAVVDDRVIVFDPSDGSHRRFQPGIPTHDNKRTKDIRYMFDRVFSETATQQQVYEGSMRDLLDGVLNGYNATVFAYGATGAGKTFTISGTLVNPGIMPITMCELFQRIEDCKDTKIIQEVYNETIRDLLAEDPSVHTPLDLREDAAQRIVVAGLSEHHPTSGDEVMELLARGNANRTKSPTKANEDSSRSHAVFQINIQQRDRTSSIAAEIKTATLTLCDLAGSERASATENRGQQMREGDPFGSGSLGGNIAMEWVGANINRSLLALGNCINALCDQTKKSQHIPYRDSKLTRLLKYSLGGNCRTVMIANISPCMQHFEETHNTLKYANRAKQIKLKVERNTVNVQHHIAQYVEIIEDLRKEIAELRARPNGAESGTEVVPEMDGGAEWMEMLDSLRQLCMDETRLQRVSFLWDLQQDCLKTARTAGLPVSILAELQEKWKTLREPVLHRNAAILKALQQQQADVQKDVDQLSPGNQRLFAMKRLEMEREISRVHQEKLQRSMLWMTQHLVKMYMSAGLGKTEEDGNASLDSQWIWVLDEMLKGEENFVEVIRGTQTIGSEENLNVERISDTKTKGNKEVGVESTVAAVRITEDEEDLRVSALVTTTAEAPISTTWIQTPPKPQRRMSFLPKPGFTASSATRNPEQPQLRAKNGVASQRRMSFLPQATSSRRTSMLPIRPTLKAGRRESLLPVAANVSRSRLGRTVREVMEDGDERKEVSPAESAKSITTKQQEVSDALPTQADLEEDLNALDGILEAIGAAEKEDHSAGDKKDKVVAVEVEDDGHSVVEDTTSTPTPEDPFGSGSNMFRQVMNAFPKRIREYVQGPAGSGEGAEQDRSGANHPRLGTSPSRSPRPPRKKIRTPQHRSTPPSSKYLSEGKENERRRESMGSPTPKKSDLTPRASRSNRTTAATPQDSLRSYVNHHVHLSPQVGAVPFSPARQALLERLQKKS